MERVYKVLLICLIVLGLVCPGCRPSSTAQLEENKAIIRHYIEAFNKSRLAAMDEALASNAVYHGTGGEELHGLEAMKQLADTFVNAFPDFHMTIENQIAEGDKVVTRYTVRGTHKGDFLVR